jgi:hypothetical protein
MVDRNDYLAGAQRLKLTNNTARFRDALTSNDPNDPIDLVRFKVSSTSNVQVTLDKIARNANVDLHLFNFRRDRRQVLQEIGRVPFEDVPGRQLRSNLSLIDKSTRSGNRDESIETTLEAGEYYLRIGLRGNGRTRYRLNLSTTPILPLLPTIVPPGSGDPGSGGSGTGDPGSDPGGGSGGGSGSDPGGDPGGGSDLLPTGWFRQRGGGDNDYAYNTAVDSEDRVFIVGLTEGNLPDSSSNGGTDAIIVAYNSSGDRLWERQLGTANEDLFADVAVDGDGFIYAAGASNVTAPSLSPPSTGSGEAYLVKFDSEGNPIGDPKTFSAGNITAAAAVAVAPSSNNVYMAGATVTLSPEIGSFVALYDSDGNELAVGSALASVTDSGGITSIAVDAAGNVYVAGITGAEINASALRANPDANLANLSDFLTGENAFVAKYDANGSELWFETLETDVQESYARRLAVDSAGNVYVVGETDGVLASGSLPANANAGGVDAFLAKFDTNGNFQWTTQFGTSQDDQGQGITVDAANTVWIAGETFRTIGGTDSQAFIASYNGDGTLLSQQELGTEQDDEAWGITVDGAGNVVVTGQTLGSLDGTNAGGFDTWVGQIVA